MRKDSPATADKQEARERGTNFWRQPHFSRRMFFQTAGALGGYVLLPSGPLERVTQAAAAVPKATAKNCILIMLRGAPSHCDTFDLKVGPWTPNSLQPTRYGEILFPRGLMPRLAERLSDLNLVRSVRSWALVHGLADQWIELARDPTTEASRVAPHIGSVVSHELGSPDSLLPAFVHLGGTGPGAGLLAAKNEPLVLNNGAGQGGNPIALSPKGMPKERFARREKLMLGLERADPLSAAAYGDVRSDISFFAEKARSLIFNEQAERLFIPQPEDRSRYGANAFGDACVVARNLLLSKMGTRFVEISNGGWDMHSEIYRALPGACSRLDLAVSALLDDLQRTGLLEETLVVMMGEFGRTVGALNEGRGRDHHPQQTAVFAGAKLPGRRVIGQTDEVANATVEPGWARSRDVRAEDIAATIYSALGINWTSVLRDSSGKRFDYIPRAEQDYYGPIHELWD